jgi:hypothetical protein
MDKWLVQGRTITAQDLQWIRDLMAGHPDWRRSRLSVHIAQQWNWRNEVGRLKDMAARTMLLKLERRGLIKLPARQREGTPNHKSRRVQADQSELDLLGQRLADRSLEDLLPLQVVLADCAWRRRLFGRLLQQHHYLGFFRPVGENLPYLLEARCGELLGCALFGAAAWRCTPRDRFIGWNDEQREQGLALVANNMRLLLLPSVRVRHLASQVLSVLLKGVSADWQRKYGHPIFLLETFVDPEHFSGASYRAANWVYVGQTQGRGRQGPGPRIRSASIKDVYVLPLHGCFREQLGRRAIPRQAARFAPAASAN